MSGQGYVVPPELLKQRQRFHEIMRRHVRAEDGSLSDMEFVKAVLKVFAFSARWPLAPDS
jgi:hypothetical protein